MSKCYNLEMLNAQLLLNLGLKLKKKPESTDKVNGLKRNE
jgi:hypothetical protein